MTTTGVHTETLAWPACGRREWRFSYQRLGWGFVRCENCGPMRLNPVPTEEELARYYASRARTGNYELQRAGERNVGLIQVLNFAARCEASGGRLFDVGCFDGGLLDLAADFGWDGWGSSYRSKPSRPPVQDIPAASSAA
jgi:hypothetical protein